MMSPMGWDAKHLGCRIHPLGSTNMQFVKLGSEKCCREHGSCQGDQVGREALTLPMRGAHLAPLRHLMQDEDVWRPTEKWCNQLFCNVVPMLLGDEEEELGGRQHFDLDTFLSDISDTLFTMTQTPSTHQVPPEDGRCPRRCSRWRWRRRSRQAAHPVAPRCLVA